MRSVVSFFRFLQRRDNERGVATTEVAIVLPVLLILMVGGVDYTRLLTQDEVVREALQSGLRVATSTRLLETGTFKGLAVHTGQGCSTIGSSDLHADVQDKIANIIIKSDERIDTQSLCITTNVQPSVLNPSERTVSIDVSLRYKGLFPGTGDIPVRVQAMGSIL